MIGPASLSSVSKLPRIEPDWASLLVCAMDSKKIEGVDETSHCEVRAWSTVVLGLANSLLFSGVLWGWASLQSFLEDDGIYQDLCDPSGCDERKERMLYLYSNGQMFSIFAYAILSLLMDRTGPVFLSIVGGLFETFGSYLPT